jgi:hypothetical protein
MKIRVGMIFISAMLLNSCFTASVFSLPNRETEAANKRQDYIAAAALPVAVAADVVTSPIQLGAIGVYSVAKAATRPEGNDGNESGWPPKMQP